MKKHIRRTNPLASYKILIALLICWTAFASHARAQSKPAVAVPDFDCRGYVINSGEVLQYVINELIRIGHYEVMDKYDIEYIAKRDTFNVTGCFSKICMKETGEKLGVAKMFTGSIQKLGDKVNVTLRLLDVQNGSFEKQIVKEFLDIKGNELMMIRVTMNEMFALANDEDMVRKLTIRADFDNSINNPYEMRLRADGPRMGVGIFTGLNGRIMQAPVSEGGFNSNPFMFQFGYQFEKQYLNEGNFQALFEFIPVISGLDQSRFIPSFTFLNGLRNNKNGWEFAFGPVFTFSKMARGYIGSDNKWHLEGELDEDPNYVMNYERRLDSRGSVFMNTGFLFGAGKTFKSGKMNIPVNAYVVPGANGMRFGLSFGWNGKDRFQRNL